MVRYLAAALLLASPALAAPDVVTDTPMVHSLVAQVMGELGTPALLLDKGSDPHDFQLRPSQAHALAEADLVFWVGPELTPWLGRALDGIAPKGEAVALLHAEGTFTLAYAEEHGEHEGEEHAEEEHAEGEEHEEHEGHAHEGTDPHAWLDPANAILWVGVIEAHLAEADPENAATYAANAAAARAGLEALRSEVAATLAPAAGKPLYVFHDAYGYFAHAFGLTIAGTVAMGDAASPGAERLAEVRDAISASGVGCVFAEANHDPDYMKAVSEGTGARIGTLDPEASSLETGPGLYADLLRGLAAEIAGCIGG